MYCVSFDVCMLCVDHQEIVIMLCSHLCGDFVVVFGVMLSCKLLKEYALRDPSAAICCVARLTVIVFTLSTVIPIFV